MRSHGLQVGAARWRRVGMHVCMRVYVREPAATCAPGRAARGHGSWPSQPTTAVGSGEMLSYQ